MAGYHIYSLDWDKFRRFADQPTRSQLLAFAKKISDGLDQYDQKFEAGDPVHDWPSAPEELSGILKQRLLRPEWYGDLSDVGKLIWERALMNFCDRAKKKDMGFRVESDGVYWDVIDLARRHHGLPRDKMTSAILSHFGARPYRYQDPGERPFRWGSWTPGHSMHTPEEVGRLLEELRAAGPTILSAPDDLRHDHP